MNAFEQKKNFNIDSTIINENYRISTAAIFYEGNWFGDYWQLETWVFHKQNKHSKMKIHEVPCNEKGLGYCKKFHQKTVAMVKYKINHPCSD